MIVARLRQRGATIESKGDDLRIVWSDDLRATALAVVKAHKPAILAYLHVEAQLRDWLAGGVLDTLPAVISLGDGLEAERDRLLDYAEWLLTERCSRGLVTAHEAIERYAAILGSVVSDAEALGVG